MPQYRAECPFHQGYSLCSWSQDFPGHSGLTKDLSLPSAQAQVRRLLREEVEGERAKEEEDGLARTKILGALSSVFDPFMDGYISLEKQNLEDVLQRTVSEDAVDRDGALPVLASSVHVFAYGMWQTQNDPLDPGVP